MRSAGGVMKISDSWARSGRTMGRWEMAIWVRRWRRTPPRRRRRAGRRPGSATAPDRPFDGHSRAGRRRPGRPPSVPPRTRQPPRPSPRRASRAPRQGGSRKATAENRSAAGRVDGGAIRGPRESRPATVPLGQPSWRAACSSVSPSNSHSRIGRRYLSGSRSSSSSRMRRRSRTSSGGTGATARPLAPPARAVSRGPPAAFAGHPQSNPMKPAGHLLRPRQRGRLADQNEKDRLKGIVRVGGVPQQRAGTPPELARHDDGSAVQSVAGRRRRTTGRATRRPSASHHWMRRPQRTSRSTFVASCVRSPDPRSAVT